MVNKLNAVTEKFYTNSGNQYKFEGKITSSEFQIYPTFDFGSRNQLRPKINGKIKKCKNYCLINLKFGIPNHLKLPLFLIIIINLAFTVFLFIKPIDELFTWEVFAVLIPVSFIIFYINFKIKIGSSTKLLSRILDAEIIK